MKTLSFIAIACMVLIIGACSDNFLVQKDGYGYFIGSNSTANYDMLCTSGDLEKVLQDSHLNKEMKDAIYHYSCLVNRSGDKVKQVYASMTPEERKDIKSAFRKNGFMINFIQC